MASTAVAAAACLWDAGAVDAVAALYLLGLVGAAMALHDCAGRFALTQSWLLWLGMIFVAAYALATSYLWSCRRGLAVLAAALRMPQHADAELAGLTWLVPANLFLVAAVVAMTFLIELTDDQAARRLLARRPCWCKWPASRCWPAATTGACCSRSPCSWVPPERCCWPWLSCKSAPR